MSRIIGIDPGNSQSAWCVIENGQPLQFAKESNSEVLIRARREWSPLEGHDLLAIEMIDAHRSAAVGRHGEGRADGVDPAARAG